MKITLLLFGIATDLLNTSSLEIDFKKPCTIIDFNCILVKKHPQLKNISSYTIAVNEEYVTGEFFLKENDIVAIIPPVSGG